MDDSQAGMPAIHTWWPYLSITSRHAVLRNPADPLDGEVLVEIERITGAAIPQGTVLRDDEVQYVAAQIEFID